MPYAIPTLEQLITQAQQDIESADVQDASGNSIDGFLEVGIVPVVVGYAMPGLAYEHYAYQSWIAKQAVPWTATGEFLSGWAALKGIYQKAATATQGTVTFAGTGTTSLPNGTPLTRSDGASFTTTAAGAIFSGTVTVPMVANVAGSAGNFAGGTTFYLSNGISGVTAQSTGSAQTMPGADQETTPTFRGRMLANYAAPPQGGDAQDYVEWALEVPGVTRAWCAPLGMGAGTVVVYIMLDVAESAYGGLPQGGNGVAAGETRATPATGDLLAVANYIFIGRYAVKGACQPVTALVYVMAPALVAQPFTLKYVPVGQQSAVQSAIAALLLAEGEAVAINPTTGVVSGGTVDLADIQAAVRAVPQCAAALVLAPADNIVTAIGQLPTLGTVTWD